MISTGPLISILVNSNNPNNLVDFFNSYEKNSYNVKNFEIVVNIDKDDYSMLNLLNDQKIIRSFDIKYIETTGGYFSGHIHNNLMLKESNPSSYFVICAGDRMLVKTKNWDKIILEYKESFRDNIFRVKCSSHKYRNYTDYWECCFAPANIAFTTRKWLDICGDWAPCFSGDAFQQCISYYMFKFDNFILDDIKQTNRVIIIDDSKSRNRLSDHFLAEVLRGPSLKTYKMLNRDQLKVNFSPSKDRLEINYINVINEIFS